MKLPKQTQSDLYKQAYVDFQAGKRKEVSELLRTFLPAIPTSLDHADMITQPREYTFSKDVAHLGVQYTDSERFRFNPMILTIGSTEEIKPVYYTSSAQIKLDIRRRYGDAVLFPEAFPSSGFWIGTHTVYVNQERDARFIPLFVDLGYPSRILKQFADHIPFADFEAAYDAYVPAMEIINE